MTAALWAAAAVAGGPRGDTEGPIRFEDIAARANIAFTLANAAGGRKHLIEPMVGGVALLDYDADGRLDVYFVNGAALPSLEKDDPRYSNRLFRQRADGTFEDVTDRAGVAGRGYGMGVAVADYDNDGFPDIFLPGVHQSLLYRNRGDGTFEDVTARAGLTGTAFERWSVGGGWFDYDADGRLDLFVVHYVHWTPAADRVCPNPSAGYRIYCHPQYYAGTANSLFRNNGDGTFTDVSARSGVAAHVGKGMSVAFADFDLDGHVDAFVANDTVPNFLFRNLGDGTFREVGLPAGVSVNDSGRPVSSMGIDVRDINDDGRPDVLITALATETFPFWRNLQGGLFEDATHASRIGAATAAFSGWGVGLMDLDNDGHKDVFTANGDVQDNTETYSSRSSSQRNLILRNTGRGTFENVTATAGPGLVEPGLHRGAAFGDLDGDGRLDVVVSRLNEPAVVLRNVSRHARHWLRIRLVGRRSNRDGIGARIAVTTPSGTQWNHVTTAVGYISSSEPVAHFGLGSHARADRVVVHWPSGARQALEAVDANRTLTIVEPAAAP